MRILAKIRKGYEFMIMNSYTKNIFKVKENPDSSVLTNKTKQGLDLSEQVDEIKHKFNFYGGNFAYADFLQAYVGIDSLLYEKLEKCCAYAKPVRCDNHHQFYEPSLCGERRLCYRDMKIYQEHQGTNIFYPLMQIASRFRSPQYTAVGKIVFTLPEHYRFSFNPTTENLNMIKRMAWETLNEVVGSGNKLTAHIQPHLNSTSQPHKFFEHLEVLFPNISINTRGVTSRFEPRFSKDQLSKIKLIWKEKLGVDCDVDVHYDYAFSESVKKIKHWCTYHVRQYMMDFVKNISEVKEGMVFYKDGSSFDLEDVIRGCDAINEARFGNKLGSWYGYLAGKSKRKFFECLGRPFIPAWMLENIISGILKTCPECGLPVKYHRGKAYSHKSELLPEDYLCYARLMSRRDAVLDYILNTSGFILKQRQMKGGADDG